MSEAVVNQLSILLADTYTLYLKTQNYHWHVTGPNFKSLHELFEEQYTSLAIAVDEIAERILTLGSPAPATYAEFAKLKTLEEGRHGLKGEEMVGELAEDQNKVIETLNHAVQAAHKNGDEGSMDLLTGRIAAHEKMHWMLRSSL